MVRHTNSGQYQTKSKTHLEIESWRYSNCIEGCLLCLSHPIWSKSTFKLDPHISTSTSHLRDSLPLASVARWILKFWSTESTSSSACAPAPRSFAWLIRQKKMYDLQVIPSSWLCKVEAVEVCLERKVLWDWQWGSHWKAVGTLNEAMGFLWWMNLRYLNHF